MLTNLASLFRKLSWFVIALGLLHLSHVEFGYPPDRNPHKVKPPRSRQRLQYVLIIAVGVPGAAWGLVRASGLKQRTPWE